MEEKNLAYRCDGSFHGILCCVYEIYTKKEFPKVFRSKSGNLRLW